MSDHDLLHALYVPFDRIHILINRTQCATSVFAAEISPIEGGAPYYRESIGIGGFTLGVFDLQRYLCDTFRLATTVPAQLILIMPLDRLSEETRKALVTGPLEELDREQLAMRISSDTAMRSFEIAELRPLGITMRDHLVARGLVAAHPEEQSFGFLIDLDQLIRLSLEMAA